MTPRTSESIGALRDGVIDEVQFAGLIIKPTIRQAEP